MRKDQEGDANAALSLYCKALEYFVPALHCESPQGLCGAWVWFWGCSTLGEAGFQPTHPSVWSFSPSDESDARRKEAIRAKVSQNPWGVGAAPPSSAPHIGGLLTPKMCTGGAVHLPSRGAEGVGHLQQQEPPGERKPGQRAP